MRNSNIVWTRRHLLGTAMGGAGLTMLSTTRANKSHPLTLLKETVTPTADPNFEDPGEYTGTSHGVHAAWDTEIVEFGGDETTYQEDVPNSDWLFIRSRVILKVTICSIRFTDFGWGTDIEHAERAGLNLFLDQFFDARESWGRVDSWATDVAVGWLLKPSDYSLDYLEYSPTSVDGIWKQLRYQASFNDRAELESEHQDTVATLNAVTIDDEPWVRAVDVDQLANTMIDSA